MAFIVRIVNEGHLGGVLNSNAHAIIRVDIVPVIGVETHEVRLEHTEDLVVLALANIPSVVVSVAMDDRAVSEREVPEPVRGD